MKSTMRALSVSFAFAGTLLTGCADDPAKNSTSESRTQHNFQRSMRSDGNAVQRIIPLKLNTCAAYLLRNDNDVPLLMSARHCVSDAAAEWCKGKGVATTVDGTGELVCESIVASSFNFDMFVARMSVRQGYLDNRNSRPVYLGDFPVWGSPSESDNPPPFAPQHDWIPGGSRACCAPDGDPWLLGREVRGAFARGVTPQLPRYSDT